MLIGIFMVALSALIYLNMAEGHANDHNLGNQEHHHHHTPKPNVFYSSVKYFLVATLAVAGLIIGKKYYEDKTRDFSANPHFNQLTEEEFANQAEMYTMKAVSELMKSQDYKQFETYKKKLEQARDNSPKKGNLV